MNGPGAPSRGNDVKVKGTSLALRCLRARARLSKVSPAEEKESIANTCSAYCLPPTIDLESTQCTETQASTRACTGHTRGEISELRHCGMRSTCGTDSSDQAAHDSGHPAQMLSTMSLSFAKISVCRSDNLALFSASSNETTMYSIWIPVSATIHVKAQGAPHRPTAARRRVCP